MSQASVSGSSRTVAGFSDDARGVTPPSSSSGRHEFLSEVIVELGFADPGTVEEAVEAAREPGMTVEKILLERGALDEDQLARAIAERHGLDFVDLDEFDVDADAMKLITRSAGLRYRAAPIAFSVDGALIVALEAPVDARAGRGARARRGGTRTSAAGGEAGAERARPRAGGVEGHRRRARSTPGAGRRARDPCRRARDAHRRAGGRPAAGRGRRGLSARGRGEDRRARGRRPTGGDREGGPGRASRCARARASAERAPGAEAPRAVQGRGPPEGRARGPTRQGPSPRDRD